MALVLEADGDPVPVEGPQALAQGVVQLACPLGGQELDDLGAPGDERAAVAPVRVRAGGQRDPARIPAVPGVLGGLYLLAGGLGGEWRERRPAGHLRSFRGEPG
jgi:hypothetical protein